MTDFNGFIEYKETGYKGYLQPYYTLEQASKELNTILGKDVYTPEKIIQLSIIHDIPLFISANPFPINSITTMGGLTLHDDTLKTDEYLAHLETLGNSSSKILKSVTHFYNAKFHDLTNQLINMYINCEICFIQLQKNTIQDIVRNEAIPLFNSPHLITVHDCFTQDKSKYAFYTRLNELSKSETFPFFANIKDFEIYAFHIDKGLDVDTETITQDDLFIIAVDLERILNNRLTDTQKEKPKGKSINKIIAQHTALTQAKYLWIQDTDQQIKISEMCDKVYKFLCAVGYMDALPQRPEALKEWIASVAPEYARTGGRPPKSPK